MRIIAENLRQFHRQLKKFPLSSFYPSETYFITPTVLHWDSVENFQQPACQILS